MGNEENYDEYNDFGNEDALKRLYDKYFAAGMPEENATEENLGRLATNILNGGTHGVGDTLGSFAQMPQLVGSDVGQELGDTLKENAESKFGQVGNTGIDELTYGLADQMGQAGTYAVTAKMLGNLVDSTVGTPNLPLTLLPMYAGVLTRLGKSPIPEALQTPIRAAFMKARQDAGGDTVELITKMSEAANNAKNRDTKTQETLVSGALNGGLGFGSTVAKNVGETTADYYLTHPIKNTEKLLKFGAKQLGNTIYQYLLHKENEAQDAIADNVENYVQDLMQLRNDREQLLKNPLFSDKLKEAKR